MIVFFIAVASIFTTHHLQSYHSLGFWEGRDEEKSRSYSSRMKFPALAHLTRSCITLIPKTKEIKQVETIESHTCVLHDELVLGFHRLWFFPIWVFHVNPCVSVIYCFIRISLTV
ncbi:hypothetical protein LXL04_014805 [Taraxacum kok-saghyz]